MCNYYPHGNFLGAPMYELGDAGSACTNGDADNDGLCDAVWIPRDTEKGDLFQEEPIMQSKTLPTQWLISCYRLLLCFLACWRSLLLLELLVLHVLQLPLKHFLTCPVKFVGAS